MTRLGIVAALPDEARTLTGHKTGTGEVIELTNHALLCISGIGAQRARAAGEQLLASGARALLSWGTAVALSSELSPGSLLLPVNVIASDLSTLAVTRDWHERLQRNLCNHLSVCTRAIAETKHILYTAAEKQALLVRSTAAAADMESAALGRLAQASGVPFAVLRVVADSADMRLPAWLPQCLDYNGHVRPDALLFGMLKHPHDWHACIRLIDGFRSAATVLTTVSRHAGVLSLHEPGPVTGFRPGT